MPAQHLIWTPRAKQRPRTTFVNGGYRTYTPHETRQAELDLRTQWVGTPIEGPIHLGLDLRDDSIDVVVTPANNPESVKLRRGDLDNYIKLISDALNGRAWTDDRQIVSLFARKV